MAITKNYVRHAGVMLPKIVGSKGGKGRSPIEKPNTLFSSDILFVTNAIGEGPIYRINPNGPQDIQIQDGSIDDLINLEGDGLENETSFKTLTSTGTTTQGPLRIFGETITTPQALSSGVTLKNGNVAGVPSSSVTLQETSTAPWDAIDFGFIINGLGQSNDNGDELPYTLTVRVTMYDKLGSTEIAQVSKRIDGKTTTSFKFIVKVVIPEEYKSDDGYRFTVEKTSADSDTSKKVDQVEFIGWSEIENSPQAYPRTALIGYAIKAENEHTGGVPNFTSMVKGLLVKVPSNYNQPILENGEIDWRQLETQIDSVYSVENLGYRLQKTGSTLLYDLNPQIYVGTWDGSFTYSWTQNPVWIVYDILTNDTYGLGIPEQNIDKYKFYQVAQYNDGCDSTTGTFNGVSGVADGSFRYKPRTQYTSIRENQIGLPKGTVIRERRFIMDVSITEQEPSMDLLNKLASTFRSVLIYSGGKISLATDMPDEYPVMMFNEATFKTGSFQISGTKESDVFTGVDVSYIEPTNHFKREIIRVDATDANDGTDATYIENISSIDLQGVTRRGQAMRTAQYMLASSKYLRRSVSFTAGTDAINLSPGDVISVSSQGTGIAYGYGGRVASNSAIGGNSAVYLEHFTAPSLSQGVFTNNTYPIALRVINLASDRMELYLVSNSAFTLTSTDNVSTGVDLATVNILGRFDNITKTIKPSSSFSANNVPIRGDLWSLGEFENTGNYYTNKSGKLFKITAIGREPEEEAITISALEYVSNIYVDSDTFINYEPTAYTDILSPLSTPPTPIFNLRAVPRRTLDGSVVVDGILEDRTERLGFAQDFSTEFFVSKPSSSSVVSNVTIASPLSLVVSSLEPIEDDAVCALSGKNGFTTPVGDIKLLCNSYTVVDTVGGTLPGNVQISVEGLSSCFDDNFYKHVLEVNDDGVFAGLKGDDYLTLPVVAKSESLAALNFIGYKTTLSDVSRRIVDYDLANNTIKFDNSITNDLSLAAVLPIAPFYVSINQLLDSRYYANNTFYVTGSDMVYSTEGPVDNNLSVNTINIDVKPRKPSFVRLYVDGILKNSGQYTVNPNYNSSQSANIMYSLFGNEMYYRVEVDHYTVPAIEVGDLVQTSSKNTFSVLNTSFSTDSPSYDDALTSNLIFKIQLADTPRANLAGFSFVNVSTNPVGTLGNISGNTLTFDYDTAAYPGVFSLANSGIYSIDVNSQFEKLFLTSDMIIPDLQEGVTVVRARNRNLLGRTSPFVQKYITVDGLPIQRVENLSISESLYREQTGGVAVRCTCTFEHIENQEVTDYEISYKLDNVDDVGSDDGGTDLTSYNTVKVPAAGVDNDGLIRFTVNNLNRGTTSGTNFITFRVTALNKNIRGITTTISRAIIGKSAKPKNINSFTGGQQSEQLTLFWAYSRVNNELEDLDLKEVIIRRAPGIINATIENFIASDPFVTVSAGTVRKSIPIDVFGSYTYLARTRDTSGNFSDSVLGLTLTTVKPSSATVVAAYSEDSPSSAFTNIPNNNAIEDNFPSFSSSNSGGLAYLYTSPTDNANGSSSGWSAIGGSPTDLLAAGPAEYVTAIRDFGTTVIGTLQVNVRASQAVKTSYNDQHEEYLEGVTDISTSDNVLIDSSFGGIGTVLGFANTAVTTSRYDSINSTLMTGPANGNVWGIWNHGQFIGDVANANSYALIAGIINANAIALGATFHANGEPSYSNSFANVTTTNATYTLVNFTQFSDTGSTTTFSGDLGAVSSQVLIRTSSSPDLYYANGNVDITQFDAYTTNDGFIPYEAGTKSFRYFQIKFAVNNSRPDEFDFTIDNFRYTIDKVQTIFSDTVIYDGTPKAVDFSSSKFLYRPTISYTVIDQIDAEANPAIVVTTASSNSGISFKLFASDGSGEYQSNSSATVMITAIGV